MLIFFHFTDKKYIILYHTKTYFIRIRAKKSSTIIAISAEYSSKIILKFKAFENFTMKVVDNVINGELSPPSSGEYIDVVSPADGQTFAKVAVSTAQDVERAIAAAKKAFPAWSSLTVKKRAAVMYKLQHLISEHADELAKMIVRENGKNYSEALAEVAKGNETVEWACSMPQLIQGNILQVSRGITCHDVREPLGVVASVVPFNFPMMVPCWTIPIALTAGNCVICKPSEKCPSTMERVAELMKLAGMPDGVFQIVNGTVESVNALCDSPDIAALSFVGSSRVAEIVAQRCHRVNKRVLSLGGAKNPLIALPDCDIEMTAKDISASAFGCAGQRCMAASVLVVVGENKPLIEAVVRVAAALKSGQDKGQVGAVIDAASQQRILGYINQAEQGGAKILLDGRAAASAAPNGTWVSPSVIFHTNKADPALHDEIFGPVLSVIQVGSREEALAIENADPHGNAACVYTQSGAEAEYFSARFKASMIGVNVGVPVPREPFSFGGMYGTKSKYGEHDITGAGAMAFFTQRRKITTKWSRFAAAAPGSGAVDRANFDTI